jgi:hypothetical protein
MTEQTLWEAYVTAASRWMEQSTEPNAQAMVEAFEAFVAVYLPDLLQAFEAVEDLRRTMRARKAA